jgi:hypothetical protein
MKYSGLIIAFVVGGIIGFAICASQNGKYTITQASGQALKIDTRTGQTWTYGTGRWEKVPDSN